MLQFQQFVDKRPDNSRKDFSDLVDRVSTASRRKAIGIIAEMQKQLAEELAGLGPEEKKVVRDRLSSEAFRRLHGVLSTTCFVKKAYCKKHKKMCHLNPKADKDLIQKHGAATLGNMVWLEVAGTPCVAWSMQGAMQKWCHESALVALAWALSLKHHGVQAMIHENVPLFDEASLTEALEQDWGQLFLSELT